MAAEVATNQQQNVTTDDKTAAAAAAAATNVENNEDSKAGVDKPTSDAPAIADGKSESGDGAAVKDGAAATADADGKKDAENHENANNSTTVTKTEAPPKYNVRKSNFEKDVIYLYQYSRTPLLPSLSPYCLKLETWLRLAGLKYENVDHKMRFRSKKGQLPFIELNGEEIADSAIIIKELSTKYEKDLDAALTLEQRNVSYAMITMLENHLIWIITYWRSKNPELVLKGYKVNLQHTLGIRLPNVVLNWLFKYTYGRKWFQGIKKMKVHGIGVHSIEEAEEFGKRDLKVLSDMLAYKPFFFGDEPTTLDVVAFAVLSQLHYLSKDVAYPLREFMAEKCPNLVGHVSRMKDRCFHDWDDICTKLDLNAQAPKAEPEAKEGKEGEQEKSTEQDNTETEKIDKELEKDKSDEKEKTEENKEKDEAK